MIFNAFLFSLKGYSETLSLKKPVFHKFCTGFFQVFSGTVTIL